MWKLKIIFINSLFIGILAGCAPAMTPQPAVNTSPILSPTPVAISISAIPATIIPTTPTPTSPVTLPDRPFITLSGGDLDYVIVRSGPAVTYSKIGLLKPGDRALALGQTDEADWFYIEFPGVPQGKAWVNSAFVKLTGEGLPIVDPQTGQVVTPVPTIAPQVSALKAVELIRGYLKQNNLQYQYLGEGSNLNNFNHPNQKVERYQVESTIFSVDPKSNWIVEIDVRGAGQTGSAKLLTQAELEQKAHSLIAELAPQLKLQTYVSEKNNKGNNYFFRWTDKSTLGFVQVGYRQDGQLLNYVNTIEVIK